jgi:NDP-sugar pyrophosphorylase family protein
MMCVYRNEGKWDQSNVRIEGDRVAYYSKEADPGEVSYIDYGLNAFDRQVIERYRDRDMPLDLAVILQDAVGEEQLGAFEVRERFYEIGKPEGLRELEDYLRSEGRQK